MVGITFPSFAMVLVVAAGGAMGAVIRYLVSFWVGAGIFGISGPLATLIVNIIGCGLMGLLAGAVAGGMLLPDAWRGFVAVGLLGALTTFSSFALDAGNLLQRQGIFMAGAYVAASVLLSLLVFSLAFALMRSLIGAQ
ncbi:CrcB family protein [Candidatus Puniceispirillum sp.]|jgi:fluoride exporter|uniref:fluoride efflux transporter FluC n=1 Tax=Candidatus Puniceispirillum sp. TaxID=2026719 RepID=UPI002FCDEFF6